MMQVSSSAPYVGAVGFAGLIGSAPQPDPLEELYAVAGTDPGSGSASPLAELAELASFIAAVRAARAGRQADADSRRDAVHLSLARAPQLPVDGQMCAVFAVNIVGFTRPDRDDDIRRYLHERLYEYLQKAFDRSGVPWAECFWEDRGDGALIVIPPEIPVKCLIGPLPDTLRGLIRRHNHVSAAAADMQLRAAAHIGPVEHDGHGFLGSDVNFAFRMLEARPLRRMVAECGAELGLIVSDYVLSQPGLPVPQPGSPGRLPYHPVPGQEHPGPGLDVPARHGALRVGVPVLDEAAFNVLLAQGPTRLPLRTRLADFGQAPAEVAPFGIGAGQPERFPVAGRGLVRPAQPAVHVRLGRGQQVVPG